MFKDFWDKKQGVIQFVSILCGVGALFIAIPTPTNEVAKNALENIQFIWMIFITVGIIVLFVNLYLFLYQLELKIQEKIKYPFLIQGSFSFILIGLATTFCFNLWQYASAIYKEPLSSFEHTLLSTGVWLILWILIFLLWKVKDKLHNAIYILIYSLLWSFFASLAQSIFFKNTFSLWNFWISVLDVFSFMLLLSAFIEWRKSKKSIQEKPDNQVVTKELANK